MALFAAGNLSGAPVFYSKARRAERPTPAERMRERNALWLIAYEQGLPDASLGGKLRPRRRWEIAELWDVSLATVWRGLQDARRDRRQAEAERRLDDDEAIP